MNWHTVQYICLRSLFLSCILSSFQYSGSNLIESFQHNEMIISFLQWLLNDCYLWKSGIQFGNATKFTRLRIVQLPPSYIYIYIVRMKLRHIHLPHVVDVNHFNGLKIYCLLSVIPLSVLVLIWSCFELCSRTIAKRSHGG